MEFNVTYSPEGCQLLKDYDNNPNYKMIWMDTGSKVCVYVYQGIVDVVTINMDCSNMMGM